MRTIAFFFLLLSSTAAEAQTKKLSFGLFWRPESTTSRQNISWRWRPHYVTERFNALGLKATLRYHLTPHLFVDGGFGFVQRKFATKAFFNQGAIPPPRQSGTNELVTGQPAYNVFEFPIELGYKITASKVLSFFLKGGYAFNYLWSADYRPNFPNYRGTYAKRYWLGGTAVASAEVELKLTPRLSAAVGASYLFSNFNKADPYLFSQDEPVIAVDHRFTSFSLGVRKYF